MPRSTPIPSLIIAATLAVATVAGCAPETVPDAPSEAQSVEALGEQLFTLETFDGNGRVCSTCHELFEFGTITPEFVQARFAEDPTGPLFRAIDSDDGLGATYERLKEHATVRVPIALDADPETGVAVRRCDAPALTEVYVNRGNPTVFNAALEDRLMVDGREHGNLEVQTRNAITTHNEPARPPTAEEERAIAAFQKSLFSHGAIRNFIGAESVPELPPGASPSEIRGRRFFEPDGICGTCHGGPMLNTTSPNHDVVVGSRFETVLVGAEPDNPNPKYDWCFVDPVTNTIVEGPTGDTAVFPAPVADPGVVMLPGTQEFTGPDGSAQTLPNGVLGQQAGPLFKIPTLWGVPDTAPYFHDNSAKTLEDVLEQYNFMFRAFTGFAEHVGCASVEECFDSQDRADIIAYLQLLSFEEIAEGSQGD